MINPNKMPRSGCAITALLAGIAISGCSGGSTGVSERYCREVIIDATNFTYPDAVKHATAKINNGIAEGRNGPAHRATLSCADSTTRQEIGNGLALSATDVNGVEEICYIVGFKLPATTKLALPPEQGTFLEGLCAVPSRIG